MTNQTDLETLHETNLRTPNEDGCTPIFLACEIGEFYATTDANTIYPFLLCFFYNPFILFKQRKRNDPLFTLTQSKTFYPNTSQYIHFILHS